MLAVGKTIIGSQYLRDSINGSATDAIRESAVQFRPAGFNLFQMSGGCKIQDRSVEVEAADHVKNIRAEVRCRRVGDTGCFLSIVGGLRKQKWIVAE